MSNTERRSAALGHFDIHHSVFDVRYFFLGVPLAKPRVGLSAASPRADYRAPGFPLLSLTRSTRMASRTAAPQHQGRGWGLRRAPKASLAEAHAQSGKPAADLGRSQYAQAANLLAR